MGRAKHHQAEHEDKVQQAIRLCIEVGAIEECVRHEGTYTDTMAFSEPDELAKEIMERNPDALESFEDLRDMKESVAEALSNAGDTCYSCDRLNDS